MKQKYSKFWYLVGALVAANLAVHAAISQSKPAGFSKLHFFDVGQGDAIYIRTVQGNDILIDAGPGDVVLSKLGRVMPFADRTLELVILTHPHADHIAGMNEILKRFKVEKIILPDVDYDSATYTTLRQATHDRGLVVHWPRLGQRIYLDDTMVLDVLYPASGDFNQAPKDINDVSVVGRLSFGQSQVLFTGDAGKDIERFLLDLDLPLNSEILKIGHHGSRHSTSQKFLQTAHPAFSIISVGKNSYGHPHEEVLGLLGQAEGRVLRTDELGDIAFQIYPDHVILTSK